MEKKRHTCKLCNKAFSCSRGLGGHMKSHGGAKGSAEKAEKKMKIRRVDFEGDGYGLRVNPKKSWKFSSPKFEALREEDKIFSNCKVCGRRFDSVKEMFGHMSHHSSKERKDKTQKNCKDCGKGFDSLRALTAHCRSHSRKRLREFDEDESECILGETMGMIRRKRSKRLRYKFSTQSCSFDSVNESRYVTEFGQEVVEGAMCLMIISGGGENWGRINSVTEFSDNNSFSLEVQSPDLKNRMMGNKVGISVCDDIGSIKINMVEVKKLVDCLSDCKDVFNEKKMGGFSENDSGFATDEEKIAKSGVPIYKSCWGKEFERAEVDEESAFVDEVEFSMKSGLNKKPGSKACDSGNNMIMTTASEVYADSQKKREHKCRTCGKVFGSHQAVGGHQRVHAKANKACSVVKVEESEDKIKKLCKIDYSCMLAELEYSDNSMEQEMEGATLIGCQTKDYMCNICLKVFATGQALGGHKRLHYGKKSEAGIEQTAVLKQQISEICEAFDLTRPVRPQEENGDVEYKSWLLGSDCIHGSFQVSSSSICQDGEVKLLSAAYCL